MGLGGWKYKIQKFEKIKIQIWHKKVKFFFYFLDKNFTDFLLNMILFMKMMRFNLPIVLLTIFFSLNNF